jgi:TadE-like protein
MRTRTIPMRPHFRASTKQILSPQARRLTSAPLAAQISGAGEDGQALVEFVLVLPILLLILFGITQFGLALNGANNETQVANEVARYATVNQDPSPTKTLAAWGKSQIDSHALSGQEVCISFPNGTSNIGDPVEVTVKGKIWWLPIKLQGVTNVAVEGKADMRLETQPTSAAIYGKECA